MVIGGRLHQGKKVIIGEGGGPLGAPSTTPFRLEYDPVQGTRNPRSAIAARSHPRAARRPPAADAGVRPGRTTQRPAPLRPRHRRLPAPQAVRACSPRPPPARCSTCRRKPAHVAERLRPHPLSASRALLGRRLVEHGVPLCAGQLERPRRGGRGFRATAAGTIITATSRSCRTAMPRGSDQALSALLTRPARPWPAERRRWWSPWASSAARRRSMTRPASEPLGALLQAP